MEGIKIKEEVLDFIGDESNGEGSNDEESNGEESNEIKKEEIPQVHENTSNFLPTSHYIKYTSRPKKEESCTSQVWSSRFSSRNIERSLDQAVEEIRKGGSLSIVASYYGLEEDLIYQTLVSRNVTHEMDILTKTEEISLVKWILGRNKKNCLVLKQHLLEKVGRMKKVSKITPFFARSKFGRMWYEYFMRSNTEIVEMEGVLLPSEKPKEEPKDLVSLYGLKEAVVVLKDFRKQKNFLSTLNDKIILPLSLQGDFFKVYIKSEAPEDSFLSDDSPELCLKSSSPDITETKQSRSDDETSISEHSENSDFDIIPKIVIGSVKSVRKNTSKRKTIDVKPTCDQCQKQFCNKAKLQRHMFTHIPPELYTVPCYKCSKRFPSKYHFLVHYRITHSDNNYTCSDCGKLFKHQTSLRKHVKRVHHSSGTADVPTTFICDICNKPFKYKNSLEAHIKYSHLKENKHHSCNVCQKRFVKRSHMLRHKMRHSKIKPLICTHCGKSFSRKYLLTNHMAKCENQAREDDPVDECQKLCQEFMEEIILD